MIDICTHTMTQHKRNVRYTNQRNHLSINLSNWAETDLRIRRNESYSYLASHNIFCLVHSQSTKTNSKCFDANGLGELCVCKNEFQLGKLRLHLTRMDKINSSEHLLAHFVLHMLIHDVISVYAETLQKPRISLCGFKNNARNTLVCMPLHRNHKIN